MATIGSSAAMGLLLVLIVLVLTLRPIVAFWVAVGIATAYAGAFVSAAFSGCFAEHVVHLRISCWCWVSWLMTQSWWVKASTPKPTASVVVSMRPFPGAQLVAKPVVFGVITTILAFLPWIFLSGSTSEFTRHITWVVILALAFSLVESLWILPSHLSGMKPRHDAEEFQQIPEADRGQHYSTLRIIDTAKSASGRWITAT